MSRSRSAVRQALFYVTATAVAFFILLPFFWMVSTSLKQKGALMAIPIQWIPSEISFEGYKKLFSVIPFGRAAVNSILVSSTATLVTVASATLAAYAFSKLEFRGRDRLFYAYLATMMVPGQVTTIPVFVVLRYLGLLDTYAGVVIPTSLFNAFGIFMLRQYMSTIPNDFTEAAVIDGASHFTVFTRIVLPLSKPILATYGVITFMGAWNDYFWPLVVISDRNKMTLPVALSHLSGQYSTDYNTLMAGSLISILPIILVYLFAQKYFEAGLQVGGLKQ